MNDDEKLYRDVIRFLQDKAIDMDMKMRLVANLDALCWQLVEEALDNNGKKIYKEHIEFVKNERIKSFGDFKNYLKEQTDGMD